MTRPFSRRLTSVKNGPFASVALDAAAAQRDERRERGRVDHRRGDGERVEVEGAVAGALDAGVRRHPVDRPARERRPRVADVRVEELEEVVWRDRLRRRVVAVLVLEHRLRREQEAGGRVVLDLDVQVVVDADGQAGRDQPARDLEVVSAGCRAEGVREVVVEPRASCPPRRCAADPRSPAPARAARRSGCTGGAGSARRSGRRSRSRGRCRTTPCASRRVDRELVPVALAVARSLDGQVRREGARRPARSRCSRWSSTCRGRDPSRAAACCRPRPR